MELQPTKRSNVGIDSNAENVFLIFNLPKELQKEIFKFVIIHLSNDLVPLLRVSKSFYTHILNSADLSPIQVGFLKHITTNGTLFPESNLYPGYHKTLKNIATNPFVNLAIANPQHFVIGRNYVPSTPSFAVLIASVQGHAECVKILLQDPRIDPSVQFDYAIEYATNECHTEVVKLLYGDWRCRIYGKQAAFYRAAGMKDNKMLDFLFTLISDLDIKSLFMAFIQYGTIENVKILLRYSRLRDSDITEGFVLACRTRQVDLVKLILKDSRCDPTIDSNKAFENAEKCKHQEIVAILQKDQRVLNYFAKQIHFQ